MDRLRPVCMCGVSIDASVARRPGLVGVQSGARRAPGLAAAWPSLSRRAVRVRLVRRVRDACAAIVPPRRAHARAPPPATAAPGAYAVGA